MPINQKSLTKGQIRKLNALRKSLGQKIADDAFTRWLRDLGKNETVQASDPVALKIAAALKPLINDKSIKLGNQGYTIKRAKGRSVKPGFVATKNTAPKRKSKKK